MPDKTTNLWNAHLQNEGIGHLIRGVSLLAADGHENLWLIVEGEEPKRFTPSQVAISLKGLDIAGTAFGYDVITPWNGYVDGPCVSFRIGDKEAVIAPADAATHDEFLVEIDRLLSNDWHDGDDVYLSDLDGSVGTGPMDGKDVGLWRADGVVAPEGTRFLPDDVLIVLGERMRLGDMSWVERDQDGDGNRYAYIVMTDGRYRRICFGDLSR